MQYVVVVHSVCTLNIGRRNRIPLVLPGRPCRLDKARSELSSFFCPRRTLLNDLQQNALEIYSTQLGRTCNSFANGT